MLALYQGSITAQRDILELIAAMEHCTCGLAIIGLGEPAFLGECGALIAARALQQRVVILPAVSAAEILEFTAGADIGIVLYRNDRENHRYCAPNKLYEYMMCGVPLVGTDLPGLSIIRERGIGEVVDSSNPRAIAGGIERLARKPDRASIGVRAREIFLAEFDYRLAGQPLLSLLKVMRPR